MYKPSSRYPVLRSWLEVRGSRTLYVAERIIGRVLLPSKLRFILFDFEIEAQDKHE